MVPRKSAQVRQSLRQLCQHHGDSARFLALRVRHCLNNDMLLWSCTAQCHRHFVALHCSEDGIYALKGSGQRPNHHHLSLQEATPHWWCGSHFSDLIKMAHNNHIFEGKSMRYFLIKICLICMRADT